MKATSTAPEPTADDTMFSEARYLRWGIGLVIMVFGGFLCWAAWAPLDRGVPVSGSVVVAGNRKAVQPPGSGVITRLLVHNGDKVSAGQLVVEMEAITARSRHDALHSQLMSERARLTRWRAEQSGATTLTLPPQLTAISQQDDVAEQLAVQRQLLHSRRAALRGELASIDEAIAGARALLHGLSASRESRQQQKTLLHSQLTGMRGLASRGYVARNQLLAIEAQYAALEGQIAENTGNIGRLERQITELHLRSRQRQDEYDKEVNTQLAEGQVRVASLSSQLAKAEADLRDTQIRAPVSGTVVGMVVFTEGGVVQAGQRLMEIVPEGPALEVEARVPVSLIDKIYVGLPVELLFSAFDQSTTPRVAGEVILVGADRLTDENTGQPYYPLRVTVTPEGMDKLTGLVIRPGMPVEGFIRTGERTLLNYLFKPLTDRLHLALTEH